MEEVNVTGFSVKRPSMVTNSGTRIYLESPDASDIKIDDIAHSLARLCRYNGHTNLHYSVAEHCILVSRKLEDVGLALEGLLHDAAEAYMGDVISPVKALINESYVPRYKVVERAIERQFRVNLSDPRIKPADIAVTKEEMRCMSLFGDEYRSEVHQDTSYYKSGSCAIRPMSFEAAKREYAVRFWRLIGSPKEAA